MKTHLLYSFPHKIGAGQICNTAWQQVNAVAKTQTPTTLVAGSQIRDLPVSVEVNKTLQWGRLRIPYRVLGRYGASVFHDLRTTSFLKRHHKSISAVHCWPLGSLSTIKLAKKLGIPTFLERPNAHTEFAYDIVEEECRLHGFHLPSEHEHSRNEKSLARELKEYAEADYLLCPSEFVKRTFLEKGFPESKLLRHRYGYDPNVFFPPSTDKVNRPFRAIYVGGCAPRKGLHYALEAWFQSGAHRTGEFIVCGGFVGDYAEKIGANLNHPSVKVMGHCSNVGELMRDCDAFILSSVEEGSALVTYEARASGLVLLVSDSSGAPVEHGLTGFVHPTRDVALLSQQLKQVIEDKKLLANVRSNSISEIGDLTWEASGRLLAQLYKDPLAMLPPTTK